MKKSAFTLVELLIVVAIILILAAILFPVFARRHTESPRSSCQSNLKQIGLGFLQYTQDYDEVFPRTKVFNLSASLPPSYAQPFGWADALQPYLKSTQIFQCPSGQMNAETDGVKRGFTDYWMNSRFSGAALKNVASPTITLLSGDGDETQGDARYAISALPQSWRTAENSPVKRHLEVGNYLFADGHVKSFKPDAIQDATPPSQRRPTFRTGENRSSSR